MEDEVVFSARKVLIAGTLAIFVLFALIIAFALSPLSIGNKTYSYVIPAGAQAKIDQGLPDGTNMPDYLELRVGDTLEIDNQDSTGHVYSFLIMRPGEKVKYKFRTKGVFVGECSFGGHRSVTVRVK